MLKLVDVSQLRPGMFLHKLDGAYLEHPFWRRSFVISSTQELARIFSTGIQRAWIDTSKGTDVEPPGADDLQPDADEARFIAEATQPMPAMVLPERRGNEVTHAAQLRQKAAAVVTAMFTEARLGKAVDAEACLPIVDEISQSVARDPGAFISLARLKQQDQYTYLHSVAVCALMVGLGRQLGLAADQVREAGLAGLMHDLGKALMPTEILNKPDKLTDDEFAVMKAHPLRGHELLRGTEHCIESVADVCLHHHERIDGSGYPFGLAGDTISLYAKMGAVCDVYDAVTSDRPYKRAWEAGESLRRMASWKGHFEPAVFQAFVKTVGIYPIGSLVKLQSGRLGVVVHHRPESLLTPKVRVFFSSRSNLHVPPEEVDLGAARCQDKIVSVENPAEWKFTNLERHWAGPLAG